MNRGTDLPDFTDKYYRDNWIMKSNTWKESYIQAADILVEVKSRATADDTDPNREFLEMELNYTMDEFDMIQSHSRRGSGLGMVWLWPVSICRGTPCERIRTGKL